MSGLALLMFLAGCAAQPGFMGAPWAGPTSPVTPRHFADATNSGHQAIEVDFELLPPQRAEQLREQGIQLPRVSAETAEPRAHRDFVDWRVTAVGFGITTGGYLLYCEGLPLPVLVPESHVDLGLVSAEPLNAVIYPNRDAALADLAGKGSGTGPSRYAYYRGAGGALIVPTLFSPATTPHIARTMLEVREHLAETVQRELKVLLVSLTGTRVLQGLFSHVRRVGPEPAFRPPPREGGLGMARALGFRSLRVVAVPNTIHKDQGRFGAVMLTMYGPHRTEWINTVRSVGAANDGGRWVFNQFGEPFAFENVAQYQARRVKERFTFDMLQEYLRHLGLSPFSEDFYLPDGAPAWLVERKGPVLPNHREYTLAQARESVGIP